MKLTATQLEQFEREGYLFLPSLFTPDEIGVLNAEVPKLCLPDDCLLKDYDVPLPWNDGTPVAALHGAAA